jgi:hypothetical protein
VQRGGPVGPVALARVGAVPEQHLDAGQVAALGGQVEQRPGPAARGDLRRAWMGVEQACELARHLAGWRRQPGARARQPPATVESPHG